MCSIFTVLTHSLPEEMIRKAFEATQSRGPDMSRLMKFRHGWMGFHRLAIMGLNERGMQPFEELELEFKSGDEAAFHRFAAQLSTRFSLVPQPLSKLARAVRV
jgi:asparagine synthetase B (glutamine-hydrolysing)